MRTIEYTRHEFHAGPERRKAELPFFALDVPYLFFEGIIPPLSVLNEVLRTGGGDGGMSPGASWKPFVLQETEYGQLVQALQSLNLQEAKKKARFVPDSLRTDVSLHRSKHLSSWLRAVKAKYVREGK
jgi:hypothetical protein